MRERRGWRFGVAFAAVFAGGWLASHAWAGLPGPPDGSTMYYSGYLELGGAPVTGSRSINVALWATEVGGSAPECQTGATVQMVTNGAFRVGLPAACVPAVQANPNLFAEVTIGTDPPLPRQHIGAVPYAVEAAHAETADEADVATEADHAARADLAGLYCGTLPTASVSSALGGYRGIATQCQALSTCGDTAHLCSVDELARSVALGAEPVGAVTGRATGSTGVYWIGTSFFAYTQDCQEFTVASNTNVSSGFSFHDGGRSYPTPVSCDSPAPFFCCE